MKDKNTHKFDGKEDRNYHQKPFDEVNDKLGQIDEASASLADKTVDKSTGSENADSTSTASVKPTDAAAIQVNDINENDERDKGDSTKEWDAENSRTGRNK